MMREIKFRAWDASRNQMIYDITCHPFFDAEMDWYKDVMQYTGLHDKNGKEIYEGDILDVDNGKRYVQVTWFKPDATFDTVPVKIIDGETKFLALHNSAWSYRCEVIGNIYEDKF
jgi:uncharacterized phage protein (TIGR01671 family)